MSDRSLKKSLPGKSNRQADENLDLFSVNRGTSLDGIIIYYLVHLTYLLLFYTNTHCYCSSSCV